MSDTWDPKQYNRFAGERERPFWDLAGLVQPVESPVVADLGCGDGRLTSALHARLGGARTTGVDLSAAMLDTAAAWATDELRFERGDIGAWSSSGLDVVFANASLQWVPDHAGVLERWTSSLAPGGQLAVQVPANADHPAHTVAVEVGSELLGAQSPPDAVAANVLSPEGYSELLDDLGFAEQHVRLQVYAMHLPSSADVVEWVKGTTLTRFKPFLSGDAWDEFLDRYRARLVAVLGDRSPYLYPFKRILLWGRVPPG